jgi:hypothetical protein
MINLDHSTDTNRFNVSLDSEELMSILKALYWYEDKLTNMERAKGRDNGERDVVVFLRSQLGNLLKYEAKID